MTASGPLAPPSAIDHPHVGVGAVLVHQGKVLLVRRGKEPLRGRWLIPGGTVEVGETLEQAVVREVQEETGVTVRPLEVLTVFDRIDREADRVRYHYVIIDFLCEYVGGDVRSGSDAEDAAFVAPEDLAAYDVPAKALEVVTDGLRRCRPTPRCPGRGVKVLW